MKRWLILSLSALVLASGLALVTILPSSAVGARLVSQWGLRISIERGATYTIPLTRSTTPRQVELCRGTLREKCTAVPATVDARNIQIVIPSTYPLGKAIVKVNERVAGAATLTQVYRRAIVVAPEKVRIPTTTTTTAQPITPTGTSTPLPSSSAPPAPTPQPS